MHRLVEPQPLDVGPVEHVAPLARHLVGGQDSGEGDVLRLGVSARAGARGRPSGKPSQGMTIDQASTQRMR